MNESQHRAAASRNADILEDPGATSDDLLARTAVPDADSRALDAVLYTERRRDEEQQGVSHTTRGKRVEPSAIPTLPQKWQVYLACWVTSIFLICLRTEAP